MPLKIDIDSRMLPIAERLGRAHLEAQEAAVVAAYQRAEDVMGESKEHYVPVKFGTLRSSGFVNRTEDGIEIGFGGASAPYALIVHERLDLRHKVGQAKYLEVPLLAALPKIRRSIADACAKVFRKAIR